jgi:hypothetical protein
LVVDTNVLISALLIRTSLPAHLIVLWREGCFDLLSSPEQLNELTRVTRYPKLRERLSPRLAGRLINELRELAVVVTNCRTSLFVPIRTIIICWQWSKPARRTFW